MKKYKRNIILILLFLFFGCLAGLIIYFFLKLKQKNKKPGPSHGPAHVRTPVTTAERKPWAGG